MIPWRDTALAFSALPDISALLLSAEPALVFARDGSRVLWANPASGAKLGIRDFATLVDRRWAETHPLRRAIASLSRAIPEQGTLARLRLTDDLLALPAACRCRVVRAGDERGVLVIALEGSGARPAPATLAAFFSGPRSSAVVVDAAGDIVAEGAPGAGKEITPANASVRFTDAERTLSLCIVERAPEREVERDMIVEVGTVLDDPGLSTVRSRGDDEKPKSADIERALSKWQVDPGPVQLPAANSDAASTPRPRPTKTAAGAGRRKPSVVTPSKETEVVAPAAGDGAPGKAGSRSVMAGRVQRNLAQKPVRFLWQTDASDRFLFLSPGLTQVVGRNAEIMGERWEEASLRLRLDPAGRIARALRAHDTWSGLTAWWPIEGSNVRVPVELTALPVFGADQSFQGYRGFGILRPAEALMPATFEARFGSRDAPEVEQLPPYEESTAAAPANVIPIRSDIERMAENARLSAQERNAFEEIAEALRDRVVNELSGVAQERRADPESEDVSADTNPAEEAPPEDTPSLDARAPEPPAAPSTPERSVRDAERTPPAPRVAPAVGAELAEARRRLRELSAILDTATDGVIILDADATIESVNASAEALFGLEAHEMEGRQFGDLLTPESRKSALDYLSGLRDSGVASLLNEGREVEAKAGIGSIPLFMTMGRISSEEGRRFCAVLRDITHWKRTEGELLTAKLAAEEASSQKSQFLARVGHEIRTPLNTVIGLAQAMIEERSGPVDNERYREHLRDIRAAGEHVVSLVDDLLDIARVEAGKLDLHFSAVPLNDVVREAIGEMQPQANRARVVLRSSLSREVPAIVADARTLRQIVMNLLANSVKHTGPGGQVIASTSLSEIGEALLRVRDTGEGMSEEELARALEPFRSLSSVSIADSSDTGLGLPLTRALVEANRATLSIKSTRGEGTLMTVTIPPTRVLSE